MGYECLSNLNLNWKRINLACGIGMIPEGHRFLITSFLIQFSSKLSVSLPRVVKSSLLELDVLSNIVEN